MDIASIVSFIKGVAGIVFIVSVLALLPDLLVVLSRETKKYQWAIFACNYKLKVVPRSASTYVNLRWLEAQRAEFYTRYAVPLLNGSTDG